MRQSASSSGRLDLRVHDVGHAVEDVVLVAHVPVQRHRLDAEALADRVHRHRLKAALVGHLEGRLQHEIPAQPRPPPAPPPGLRRRVQRHRRNPLG